MLTIYKNSKLGMIVVLIDGISVAVMTIGEWSKLVCNPVMATSEE